MVTPPEDWRAENPAELVARLRDRGGPALRRLEGARLAAAWTETVDLFRRPTSPERLRLEPALLPLTGLSAAGLAAGLEVVLRGVAGEPAARRFDAAPLKPPGLIVVVLASNLPGLAVQPLLQALAQRQPTLLKSPTAEPLFAPAFVAALVRREPALADAVAAITWPGGSVDLEAPLLAAASEVVAYGEAETLADLARRAPGKVRGHGPKASLAVVGRGADIAEVARGLARDVALFDQRGCLSVQAVYTTPEVALSLAPALARALGAIAAELPPGPLDPALAALVQQARAEAEMRGLEVHALPLRQGTVVVEPDGDFLPTPGLRTVRVHPLADLERLPALLSPWSGRLQGVALAGAVPGALEPALASLGVSRFAPPGELQAADASWDNPAVGLISD